VPSASRRHLCVRHGPCNTRTFAHQTAQRRAEHGKARTDAHAETEGSRAAGMQNALARMAAIRTFQKQHVEFQQTYIFKILKL
jgi:hypothetical protein